jgi:hypothetical protein
MVSLISAQKIQRRVYTARFHLCNLFLVPFSFLVQKIVPPAGGDTVRCNASVNVKIGNRMYEFRRYAKIFPPLVSSFGSFGTASGGFFYHSSVLQLRETTIHVTAVP